MDKETIFAVLEDAEAVGLIDKETMEELIGLFATRILSDKAISALKGEQDGTVA